MELVEQHRRAMAEFDARVRQLTEDRWRTPTPCDDWDVRTLVNHLVVEQWWTPHLLRGETLEQVGDRYDGDLLGDDPVAAWIEAAARARDAVTAPGALEGQVHTSGQGQIPASVYVGQMTMDLAIHAWDLARSLEVEDRLDAGLVDALIQALEPQADHLAATGLFAPPVEVGEAADPQTRMLAIVGRDARVT